MPRRLPEKTKNAPCGGYAPEQFFFHITPVKENQELEVVIDDIGSRGDGIARVQGYLIFVPHSRLGERVKVRILTVREKFAIAEKIA